MNILSIQSHVAYGHVGNAAAVFALQRMGHEVWPIHTVRFSNHPGHGGLRGVAADPGEIADIVAGLDDLGVLAGCDAVLSGYLGHPETGDVILDAVRRVKARNPQALYLCDPVMGDRESGAYVDDGVIQFFRERAIGAADIVIPNAFELEILVGRKVESVEQAVVALNDLRAAGPGHSVVTGLARIGSGGVEIEAVAADANAVYATAAPEIAIGRRPDGAGDLFTAVFLADYLESRDLGSALGWAVSATHGVLRATAEAGAPELRLIDAQEELVSPSRRFAARRLR